MKQRSTAETKRCAHCGALFFRDTRCTWAHWGRARFCSRPCSAQWQAAQKAAARGTMQEEFSRWFKPGDGCWEWRGARDKDGYGIFSYKGKSHRAHRVALEFDGRFAGLLLACHHCDNPSCVRPDHLFVGTNQDNMRDMIAKGRGPIRYRERDPNWKGFGTRLKEVSNG